MTFEVSTFAGPTVTDWPRGCLPRALLGGMPVWLLNPTRRRQPDDSWTYAGLVAVEDRDRARSTLDVLVRAGWLVILRPAGDGLLEVQLDPPALTDRPAPRPHPEARGTH